MLINPLPHKHSLKTLQNGSKEVPVYQLQNDFCLNFLINWKTFVGAAQIAHMSNPNRSQTVFNGILYWEWSRGVQRRLCGGKRDHSIHNGIRTADSACQANQTCNRGSNMIHIYHQHLSLQFISLISHRHVADHVPHISEINSPILFRPI